MLIEGKPKWQGYGLHLEAEDDHHGQVFCAKKYQYCRAVYLMTLVSGNIMGSRFYHLQEVVLRC